MKTPNQLLLSCQHGREAELLVLTDLFNCKTVKFIIYYLIVSNIFQVFSKARGGIAHVAVVFFDEQESENLRWTTSLLSLRKAGVRVLLVGVGRSFNYTHLRSLVENDRGVIIIDSYFDLLKNSVGLANTTCVTAG